MSYREPSRRTPESTRGRARERGSPHFDNRDLEGGVLLYEVHPSNSRGHYKALHKHELKAHHTLALRAMADPKWLDESRNRFLTMQYDEGEREVQTCVFLVFDKGISRDRSRHGANSMNVEDLQRTLDHKRVGTTNKNRAVQVDLVNMIKPWWPKDTYIQRYYCDPWEYNGFRLSPIPPVDNWQPGDSFPKHCVEVNF